MSTPTTRPLIVYAGHQDDAELWSWLIIVHHLLVGRRVIVVLATDGSTSTALPMLAGTRASGWWPKNWHQPDAEGYESPTVTQLVASRDAEMVDSCLQLGIAPEDIRLEAGWREAALTPERARELILRYHQQYPTAGHYTTWWGDTDPAHAALGEALRGLTRDGTLTDARWVVRRTQATSAEAVAAGVVQYTTPDDVRVEALRRVRASLECYRAWAPRQGRYAVGYHSVSTEMEAVRQGAPNWIIRTP
ncbi:hypothetical protein [Streptomyces sp. DH12]|uniref:hypothetical protein n=1 Tax=Streptomyces sp. DH12 TaxID=2857010 RepID=UPI001E4DDA76|nr:hypothetical protein [Streptomyces sp. DH12]